MDKKPLDGVRKHAYSKLVSGFTKLFESIIHSTVWDTEMHVKVTWITMLAMSDRNGRVCASVPGLAKAAGVSLPQVIEALTILSSPDEWSRTKANEGRRIAEIDGGWQLLNYLKYREQRDSDERRIQTREAVARHRQKVSKVNNSKPRKPKKAQAEAEAEAEDHPRTERADSSEPSRTTDSEPFIMAFTVIGPGPKAWSLTQDRIDAWVEAYPGVDVHAECKKARAWLDANPAKRKTSKGMPKFLNGWIARSVDSGKVARPANLPRPVPAYSSNWFEECQQLHGGKCGSRYVHGTTMQTDTAVSK